MARLPLKKFPDWRILFCLSGLACTAHSTYGQYLLHESPYDDQWDRHFRLGMMVGFNMKASFNTSGTLNLPAGPAGVFDDGYVLVDNTGNAGGLTVNWGYQNESQDPGGNSGTLTMHQATSFQPTGGGGGSKDSTSIGMDLVYGGTIKHWDTVRVGWEFEFGFMPISISQSLSQDGTADRNVVTFDTGGVAIIPTPGAPWQWQGSPDGGSSGSGPAINATPHPGAAETGLTAHLNGSRKLDLDLFAISVGPSLYWDASEWVGFSVSAGPTVGIVTGEYKYDDTITITSGSTVTHSSGNVGVDKVLFGANIDAQVYFHVVEGGDLYLGVKYMPLGDVNVNSGGRQAKLDLSGAMYITAGLNWPF